MSSRRRSTRRSAEPTRRVTVRSLGDRGDLEALALEIRRLARELGVEVAEVRIERVGRPPTRSH